MPDQNYYQDLIAKAILYRRVRQIVKSQRFQGFWANIADYTVAYISFKTAQRIDLKKIWRTQTTTEAFDNMAAAVANAVYNYLTETCSGINTTQWCKKEQCWNAIKADIHVPIEKGLVSELLPVGQNNTAGIDALNDPEKVLIEDIHGVSADIWFAIASWGKETANLRGYQCGIAGTLGRYVGWSKMPSIKQAKQGIKILNTAYAKGFIVESKIKELVEKNSAFLDD